MLHALLTTLLLVFAAGGTPATDSTLRVMTYNIRFNNPGDGEHAWPHRKDRVAGLVRFHRPDLVGMQEALKGQIDDLAQTLPGYAWFGVGRDDGGAAGEFSPVFYRRDRLELLDQGTVWLSETPEVPGSIGWDAAITRIVTWGRFRDLATGDRFYFFNTHFDHQGQRAREESARLLLRLLQERAGDAPAILTGDFNVTPDNPAYTTLASALHDAREVSATPPYGPEGTFYGFTVTVDEAGRRIDHIFVRPDLAVSRYAVLADQWEGHYPSDHLPVVADVALPR